MIIYGDIYIYVYIYTWYGIYLNLLHYWHYLLNWASPASLADCWLFGPWRHELSSATIPGWRLKHIEGGAVQKAVTKVSRSWRDEMMLSKLRQKAGHMSSSWMGFGMEPVPDRSQQSWPLIRCWAKPTECASSETVVWTITSVDPALIAGAHKNWRQHASWATCLTILTWLILSG